MQRKRDIKKNYPKRPRDYKRGLAFMNVALYLDKLNGDYLSILLGPNHSGSWILDNAYSFNMMPIRGWFDIYKFIDSCMVTMGDHSTCKITNLSGIQINMSNGVMVKL